MRHVVVGQTVLVADAVLDDGIGRAYALEEIPSVIGVVPRAATDIVVSGAGKLLVCKTVGVATEVCWTMLTLRRSKSFFVVEVIVGIDIEDDIVSAFLHLTSRIGRAVDVEIFEEAV